MILSRKDAIKNCILGTAVGDSLGLPFEFLGKERQLKLFPSRSQHNFVFDHGMFSDDTEHTIMVAKSLIYSGGDIDKFTSDFSKRLKYWLIGLPAGIGLSTLRSIIRLWAGFPPEKSGIFSAGNGPAMRASVIGIAYGDNLGKMVRFVKASTRVTHTDPKAEYGAIAVALAAWFSYSYKTINFEDYFATLRTILKLEPDHEFSKLIDYLENSVINYKNEYTFIQENNFENGVSGYIIDTLKAVIFIWGKYYKDFEYALTKIIEFGGDTDTTAAILGGILGAGRGCDILPDKYTDNIFDMARSKHWMQNLGEKLYNSVIEHKIEKVPNTNVLLLVLRNIIFFLLVLIHGIRRGLPPY